MKLVFSFEFSVLSFEFKLETENSKLKTNYFCSSKLKYDLPCLMKLV